MISRLPVRHINVVLIDGIDPGEQERKLLQDHVKATIAPYKYPRSIKFTDALPKTQTGKIQRFKLKLHTCT